MTETRISLVLYLPDVVSRYGDMHGCALQMCNWCPESEIRFANEIVRRCL